MFFKNKSTGVVWEVVANDHINRCQNDPNYEVVEDKKENQSKSGNPKNTKSKNG
jgi:hypothetical protein